jgi:4'-phosphopantetheinyl transferase
MQPGDWGSDITTPDEMLTQLDTHPHLWIVALDRAPDATWVSKNEPLLSEDERHRYDRYLRTGDRHLFLAAHVFVRNTLSRYAPIAAADWIFKTNRYGRPEIANPGSPPDLRFNLAHTAGMVAMLVHDEADGGVDVEHLGNVANPVAMSKRVFAETERRDFLALDKDRQQVGFYRLWTLKEAFIKAKGKGLALPLKDFAFTGPDRSEIQVACADTIEPDPDAWHFTVRQPSPQFVVATAYRAGVAPRRRAVSVFQQTLSGS